MARPLLQHSRVIFRFLIYFHTLVYGWLVSHHVNAVDHHDGFHR